jgi:hypothetical protein
MTSVGTPQHMRGASRGTWTIMPNLGTSPRLQSGHGVPISSQAFVGAYPRLQAKASSIGLWTVAYGALLREPESFGDPATPAPSTDLRPPSGGS